MNRRLIIGALVATAPIALATNVAAEGTNNGNAGCVAQVNTVSGAPGPHVSDIKAFFTPIPGSLISGIARDDRTACQLP